MIIKKVVLLSLAWIWDYLMQTPTIVELRKSFPNYQIDLITMSWAIENLGNFSWLFDNVYKFDLLKNPLQEFIRLFKHWRKEKYDISILWFPAYRKEYHITQFILWAKKRFYHKFNVWWYIKEFHFLWTDYVYFDEDKHNVLNNLHFLKLFWINKEYKLDDIEYILKIPDTYLDFWKKFITQNNIKWKIIWIHPWSTNSPAWRLRRWWWENYSLLIKELVKKWFNIFIFWWPEEKDEIINLKKDLDWIEQIFFIEENFLNAIWILQQVDLLITNDNWFWHIWTWLEIKTLVLWWTTFEKWSSPIGKNTKIFKKTKKSPWYRYELKRKVPKWVSWWMEEIKVNDVLKEIEKFILKI